MDTLTQLNTALVGRYAIEREIGAGGMATVYLARDLRHDRRVAVKVLKPELAAVLGVERFLSEIKVTANLQHPNLLPLFDSGEAGGQLFYVMPYIDGESLRARLEREKQLTIDETIHIATAIAAALGHAHKNGVIHRDLKPENILLQDGEPVIADFGIALAVSNAGGSRITQTGISLGTPQYMSPEQATGDRQIDARSDIYSLAAMTYEMLCGESPHAGPTAQAVIARVLTERPRALRVQRPSVPEHVDAAIQRGLEKLPADRFPSVKEFADTLTGRTAFAPQPTRERSALELRHPLVVALATAVITAIAMLAVPFARRGTNVPARSVYFSIESTPTRQIIDAFPAVSPDGRVIAFAAESAGVAQLYVRAVDGFDAHRLPGTERLNLDSPIFFSPDGTWIGFVARAKLERVRADGSQPAEVVASASDLPQGGSWSPDNSIIFAPDVAKGLVRIAVGGGEPTAVTTPDRAKGEIGYAWPDVLPNGKAVLYGLITRAGWSVGVHSFASNTNKTLIAGATMGRFIPPATLMYVKDGRLYTTEFDANRLTVGGRATALPLPVTGSVRTGGPFAYYAASQESSIAYVSGERVVHETLVRVDRSGNAVPLKESAAERPRFAPRGDALIAGDSAQISIFDMKTGGTRTRITSGAPKYVPVLSPDGSRVIYTSYQDGSANLYLASLADPNKARRLVAGENRRYASSWSRDGDVAFIEIGKASIGIFSLHIDGDSVSAPVPIATTGANDYHPRFSPDGKWLAYTSERTGRAEVYVQAFPAGGTPRRVSPDGGSAPVWNPNGRELFYRNDQHLMSVAITTSAAGIDAGTPRELFQLSFGRDPMSPSYDVSPDGTWFIVQTKTAIPPRRLDVIVNWRP